MAFVLQSPAFQDGSAIPPKYARDGSNVSPPLAWRDAPLDTRSFALIVEDPDAPSGTFRHWAAYDIPSDRTELLEGTSTGADLDVGAKREKLTEGVNDFGRAGYDGPQPPPGHGVHHYHFRLVALDVDQLDLPGEPGIEQVWEAAKRHILAETELIGTFEKR